MKKLGRWWKHAAAALSGLLVLVIVVIGVTDRRPALSDSAWSWVLSRTAVRGYINVAGFRKTGPGRLILRGGAALWTGQVPSVIWDALEGSGDLLVLNEIFFGARRPGDEFPTGQLSLVARGDFAVSRIAEQLTKTGMLSFTRKVNGRTVHRLRLGVGIPPELVFLDDHHLLCCDAQSTAETVDPAGGSPMTAPLRPEGCLVWVDGVARPADLPPGGAFPEGCSRVAFTMTITEEQGSLVLWAKLKPDCPAEEFAAFLEEGIKALPFFGPNVLPLQVTHENADVHLECLVSGERIERFFGLFGITP